MYKPNLCTTITAVAVVLPLLAGCSTTASGNWKEPRTSNAPFQSILIIAATPDDNMRIDLEEQLARDLSGAGTKTAAANKIESRLEEEQKTRESVVAMIADTKADALLVIRMGDQATDLTRTKAQAYINVGPQVTIIEDSNVTEVWASDYTVGQTEGQLVIDTDTKMQALLYDVKDQGRLVYIVAAETKYQEDGSDSSWIISGNISAAVSKQLRKAGLVQ